MIVNSLLAFLHFAAAFMVMGTLLFERITFSRTPTLREAKLIQKVDQFYGMSAVLVIVFGLLRVYFFEKGSSFYFSSPFFWVKMGLFAMVGLLSIYPTIKMIKWKAWIEKGEVPQMSEQEFLKIKRLMNWELIFLTLAIFSASLMAKGIAY